MIMLIFQFSIELVINQLFLVNGLTLQFFKINIAIELNISKHCYLKNNFCLNICFKHIIFVSINIKNLLCI
jgi:hypothetical protein